MAISPEAGDVSTGSCVAVWKLSREEEMVDRDDVAISSAILSVQLRNFLWREEGGDENRCVNHNYCCLLVVALSAGLRLINFQSTFQQTCRIASRHIKINSYYVSYSQLTCFFLLLFLFLLESPGSRDAPTGDGPIHGPNHDLDGC